MNISCLYGISPNVFGFRIALASLYFMMTLTATILNCLVLAAIWKTSSLHKPSYILLANMAAADLINGGFIAPSMALSQIGKVKIWKSFYCELMGITRSLSYWMSAASIFILTFISVDRLLAVSLRNRYQTVVTLRRVTFVALLSWASPLLLILSIAVDFSESKFEMFMPLTGAILIIVLGTNIVSYSMAYRFLKKLTSSVSSTNGTSRHSVEGVEVSSNVTTNKYRKTLNTMVIICVLLVLFFTPFLVCSLQMSGMFLTKGKAYEREEDERRYTFWLATECLVISNSAVNPLLYLWRMKDLREAIRAIVRKISCIQKLKCLNEQQNQDA